MSFGDGENRGHKEDPADDVLAPDKEDGVGVDVRERLFLTDYAREPEVFFRNTADYGISNEDFAGVVNEVFDVVFDNSEAGNLPVGYDDADIKIEGSRGFRAWMLSPGQLAKYNVADEGNERGERPIMFVVNGLSSRDFSFLQKLRLFWQKMGWLVMMVECRAYKREDDSLHVHSFKERNDFLLRCVEEVLGSSSIPADRNRVLFCGHSMGGNVIVDCWQRLISGEIGLNPFGVIRIAPPAPLAKMPEAFEVEHRSFLVDEETEAGRRTIVDCVNALMPKTEAARNGSFIEIPPSKHAVVFNKGDLAVDQDAFAPFRDRLGFVCGIGRPFDSRMARALLDLTLRSDSSGGGVAEGDFEISLGGSSSVDIELARQRRLSSDVIAECFREVPTFGLPRIVDPVQHEVLNTFKRWIKAGAACGVMDEGSRSFVKEFLKVVMGAHNFEDAADMAAAIAATACFVRHYLPHFS